MGFVGGRRRLPLVASGRLENRVNYLIGKDPRRWQTDVPSYSEVSYRGVWPGIDVSFYGNQRQLEYDFKLRPGADPGQIGLRFAGARRLRLDQRGDLVIGLRGGTVRERAPRAYQRIEGVRKTVASRYVLLPGHRVGLRVGGYDRRRPLVIDPVLTYATYLGGSAVDFANPGIAVDSAGSLYLAGPTSSTNFPATPGAVQKTRGGGTDGYVAKLNPTGTAFSYVTYLGGSGEDYAEGVEVDSAGRAYVSGGSASTNFPTTTGAAQTTNGGTVAGATLTYDAFVAKLDPAGATLSYSTYLGGIADDGGYAIALDGSGSAYTTGSTASTNFPTTTGAAQGTNGGGVDTFVAKLNPAGSGVAYSTYLGGAGDDPPGYQGIALDAASGSAYIAGTTSSPNFPVTAGAAQVTYGGGASDAFLTKLNPTGSALGYSTYVGAIGADNGQAIALDASGGAYLAGFTSSTNFPATAGAAQGTYGGGAADAFLARFNPAGLLSYATYLGGRGAERGYVAAKVDAVGSAYVVGFTSSTDFRTTADAVQPSYGGGSNDGFVVKLNPRGSALVYGTYLGGSGFDGANGVAVDAGGNAYVTGSTGSTNFPTTPGSAQSAVGGSNDAFLTKMPTPTVLRSTSTSASCSPGPILAGSATSCTATVTDTDGGPTSTPSGAVSFATDQSGGFSPAASCALSATGVVGQASCQLSYTPAAAGSGTHTVTASYGGDGSHASSTGNGTVGVSTTPVSTTPIIIPTGATLPSLARIAAALKLDLRDLVKALKKLGLDGILKQGGFTEKGFDALTAGRLEIEATATTSKKGKRGTAAATTKIARGAAALTKPGTYTVKVKLTSKGKKLLRKSRRLKVKVSMTFTDSAARVSKAAKTVTLKKRKR